MGCALILFCVGGVRATSCRGFVGLGCRRCLGSGNTTLDSETFSAPQRARGSLRPDQTKPLATLRAVFRPLESEARCGYAYSTWVCGVLVSTF